MADPFTKYPKIKNFFKALKSIFLAKLQISVLFLIVLITLSILAFNWTIPEQTPTGQAILEPQCPECICEEEECEPDCDLCPIKTKIEKENIIYYSCPGGALVEDSEDCLKYLPNVSEEYSGKVKGITLSIDRIKYEKEGEEGGCITRIDYTIINKGNSPIVPRINAKVYKEWDKELPKEKDINPEIVVNKNDYVKRKENVRICFKGEEQTLRLMLTDTLKYPYTKVVALRDFDLDYSD